MLRHLHALPPGFVAAILRFYRRIEQAEIDLIAAGVAFFAFLAIFPAAAAVIAIWGFVSNPDVIRGEVALLRGVLPPDVYNLVLGQVEALLSVNSSSLGWTTVISTVLALWSARAGVAALIRGLNAIHHLPNRSGHWHQLRAISLTMVMVGLVLAALTLSVVVPVVVAFLPKGTTPPNALADSNLLMGVIFGVLAVGLAFRIGPNYTLLKPPLLSWGLLVSVILWVLVTRGFMLYLANFPAYNRVYGSIGAVAAMLMWLYLSAYAVLLGAAVDAEMQNRRKARTQAPRQ
ncbi:MAG: YihY/virulence factor BrkB family protein [Cypionkella sp.]|nr:YihY/virulence factor BrkB family protein [Cypionkella sp.]